MLYLQLVRGEKSIDKDNDQVCDELYLQLVRGEESIDVDNDKV